MLERYNKWIDLTFGKKEDSDILKARKRIVISMQLIGIPLGIAFILFFFMLSEYFLYPGFITLFYLLQVLITFWILSITKQFSLAIWSFVTAVILMAVGIHVVQGGFYNSSGTILYAFIAPTFAAIGINRNIGAKVLGVYFLLVILVFFFESKISLLGKSEIPLNFILLLVAINLCAVGFFVFSMLVLFIGEIDTALQSADKLLLNILPDSIAHELKKNGFVETRKHENISVLFTDFKSFTSLSESTSPEKLVKSIDFYFRNFDRIITKHGLEKIKTIGDAYMCAGGIPEFFEAHENNIINAAKEILRFVDSEKIEEEDILKFEVRVGIHTGPVIAGVVGSQKWQYDIWGDTVNLASRMESNSEAGKINISETTYTKIRGNYNCTYRGEFDIKGKGKIKMYFVE